MHRFSTWLLEQRYAPTSVRIYTLYARRAADSFERSGREVIDATPAELRDWWATMPASASSRNQARKAMVAFFTYRGIEPNPARALPRVPASNGLPRPLSPNERLRFCGAATRLGGIHEMLAMAFDGTACRFSELRLARWHQFNLGDEPCWWVEGKGAGRGGSKERVVPLTPSLTALLRSWRVRSGSPDWLFARDDLTGPISESIMRARFADICDAAGIEGRVVPHRIRHTTATRWLDATEDLAGVQDLLGHADPASTRIYTKTSPKRLRRIVDRGDGPLAA